MFKKTLFVYLILVPGLILTSIASGVDDAANSDIAVSGTVGGSYTDTQSSNNVYESIEEIESGGKPANRYSYLEHKWTINVTGGNPVTFYLEAYHTSNSENDDFVFAYSTDDSSYTDMLTVTKTADDDTYQSYELPSDTNGTVYVRVMDTDQTAGNITLDTIYVDHMYIRSEGGGGPTPGVTIVESGGSTDVNELGPTSDTYTIVLDSQPTDTVTITVDPDLDTEVNGGGPGNPIDLFFDVTNWDSPNTVTVTAIDDNDVEGPHTSTITHIASSNDPNYNGIAIDINDVVANVADNDATSALVWYVDGAAAGGDGTSWGTAFKYLQDALAAAVSGDQIWVAEGTYYPDEGPAQPDVRSESFVLVPNVSIYGGFPNPDAENPDPSMDDRDPQAHVTTLSGEIQQDGEPANNSYHVVTADDASIDNSTILDGFTISGGNADDTAIVGPGCGGGIYCNRASPTIKNCVIKDNSAIDYGGGIYCYDASPTIDDCMVKGNRTTNGSAGHGGGGMYFSECSPLVERCVIKNNDSAAVGGGVYNDYSSAGLPMRMDGCFVIDNEAKTGAGVANYGGGTLTITNTILEGNTTIYTGGGIRNGSPLVLINCTFSKNHASSLGGGIYNFDNIFATNCVFWGNTDEGGMDESAQIHLYLGSADVTYSCIQRLDTFASGEGNIDDNPRFVSSGSVAYWKMNDNAPNPWVSGLGGVPTELISNNNFDTDDDWVFQGNWVWLESGLESGGLARCPYPSGDLLSYILGAEEGKKYAVSCDVVRREGIVLNVKVGGSIIATLYERGTYIVAGIAGSSNSYLQFEAISCERRGIRLDNVYCICLDDFPLTRVFNDASGDPRTNAHATIGQIDGALTFDGVDDYVDCGNDGSFDITDRLSISAWVKFNTTPTTAAKIVSKNGAYNLGYDNTAGKWCFEVFDTSGSKKAYSSDTVSTDDWHHFLGVMHGDQTTLYIDGAEQESANPSEIVSLASVPVTIGKNFSGAIDDVMIFDWALTADEIQQIYDNGLNGQPTNFVDPVAGEDGILGTEDDGLQLQADSPCIETGDPTTTSDDIGLVDVAGNQRFIDFERDGEARVDMGAYEQSETWIWYVDGAGAGGDGTSWGTAFKYLKDALDDSNSVSGDEIWVAKGTYYPDETSSSPLGTGDQTASFDLKDGVAIYGGFPTGGGQWEERDPNIYPTVLSGDIDNDIDYCLDFDWDGVSTFDHVQVEVMDDPTSGLGNFAISFWMKSIDGGRDQTLLSNYNSTAGAQWLGFYWDQQHSLFYFGVHDGSSLTEAQTAENIFDDQWHHIVGVRDASGGTMTLYIDNIEVLSISGSVTPIIPSSPLWMGARPDHQDQYFRGRIDDVMVFENVLIPGDIDKLYTNKQGGLYPLYELSQLPIAWWEFYEGEGTTTADSIGGIVGSLSIPKWTADSFGTDFKNSNHVVTADMVSGTAILDGFTISGGYAKGTESDGGGVYCNNASPTIHNCIVTQNISRQYGGGIYNDNSSSPLLVNCLIYGNWCKLDGGGICNRNGSDLTLINCTMADNKALGNGGGMYCDNSSPTLTNCILWGNRDQDTPDPPIEPDQSAQIDVYGSSSPIVTYSCIQDGIPGDAYIPFDGAVNNNIDNDPTFLQNGTWKWKMPDSDSPIVNGTTIPIDVSKMTFYDFQFQQADFGEGAGHSPEYEDSGFVGDSLNNDGKPAWGLKGQRHTASTSSKGNFEIWWKPDDRWNGPINTNRVVSADWICIDALKAIFDLNFGGSFFPIDGKGFGNQGEVHNYYFTMEYHTKARYVPGQTLDFISSDDIFVYVNGYLVLDRGGYWVHYPSGDPVTYPGQSPSNVVDLDGLGLQDGEIFDLDIFWAQRSQPLSILKMQATFEMEPYLEGGNYRLNSGSSCIDHGDSDAVPLDVTVDLDFNPRFIDDAATPDDNGNAGSRGIVVDMGAYEYLSNQRPEVDVGTYDPIVLPTDFVVLDATVTDDGLGIPPGVVTTTWTVETWPAGHQNTATFDNPSAEDTTVRGLASAGDYTLRLTADDGELFSYAETVITVYPQPWVDAGYDQTVELTDDVTPGTAVLTGQIRDDPTGIIDNTLWECVDYPSGGSGVTIQNPTGLSTTLTFPAGIEDEYSFRQTGLEGSTIVDSDIVKVAVGLPPSLQNNPPVIESCGSNQTINLQPNFVNIDATVTDDGLPRGELTYSWTVERWPSAASPWKVEFSPSSYVEDPVVIFHDTAEGDYILKLIAFDGELYSEACEVVITVATGASTLWVDAGEYLPVTPGSVGETIVVPLTDALVKLDDTPVQPPSVTVKWEVLSGEDGAMVTFSDPGALWPHATFDKSGNYTLQLTATTVDETKTEYDTTVIEIGDPPSGFTLEVDAGQDKEITQPAWVDMDDACVRKDGNPDCTTAGILARWSKVDGPGIVDFEDPAEVNTSARFSAPGIYSLKLEASYGLLNEYAEVTVIAKPNTRLGGGEFHSLIILEDNTVMGFGWNQYCQLGIGTTPLIQPVPSSVLTGQQQHSSGYLNDMQAVNSGWRHSLAMDKNGEVWAWGGNRYGQLGVGIYKGILDPSPIPMHVRGGAMGAEANIYRAANNDIVTSVCVVDADQDGIDDFIYFSLLGEQTLKKYDIDGQGTVDLFYLGAEIDAVHAISDDEFILSVWGLVNIGGNDYEDGDLFVYNRNGTAYMYLSESQIFGAANVDIDAVHVIDSENIILSTSGTYNNYAEIGDLEFSGFDLVKYNKTTGQASLYFSGFSFDNWLRASTEAASLLDNGHLVMSAWETTGDLHIADLLFTRYDLVEYSFNQYLQDIVYISAGRSGEFSMAVGADNSAYTWGGSEHGHGLLGIGAYSDSEQYLPKRVLTGEQLSASGFLENIIEVSGGAYHSMFLEKLSSTDLDCLGRVYTSGEGVNYCLGNGLNVDKDTPVLVHAGEQDPDYPLENIVAISAGWYHSMALEELDSTPDNDSDGRVYTWGFGGATSSADHTSSGGRLGNGLTDDQPTPVLVHAGEQDLGYPNLNNIVAISAGEGHCMALEKIDGEGHNNVYTWGSNNYSQLGNNETDNYFYTPVKVVAPDRDYDGSPDDLFEDGDPSNDYLGADIPIVAICAGYWHCLAMDLEGNIYSWGRNDMGQLALGSYEDKNIPQPVMLNKVYNLTQDIWFDTVQDAHNSGDTLNGDEIIVFPGRYVENITLDSKNLTIRSVDPADYDIVSSTIIDGFGSTPVTFELGNSSTLSGLTITGGNPYGILCKNTSEPTIINNRIFENKRHGIYCDQTSNYAVTIMNNFICDNGTVYSDGHGIYLYQACNQVRIRGNTIAGNDVGIYSTADNNPVIVNCIVSGNPNGDLSGGCSATDSCVGCDPAFVNAAEGDYHLTSLSSCINTGDVSYVPGENETDIDFEPRKMGATMDMGADEYSPLKVYAGEDERMTLLEVPLTLTDATVEENGLGMPTTLEYLWTVVKAPENATVTFTDTMQNYSEELNTSVIMDKVGTYILKLTAIGYDGGTVFGDGQVCGVDMVTIFAEAGVDAGEDQYIILPADTTSLSGRAPGAAYTEWWYAGQLVLWQCEEGGSLGFEPPQDCLDVYQVDFPDNIINQYVLWLLAYDDEGWLVGYDSVVISVGAGQLTVEAGHEKEVTLSGGSAWVDLYGTDNDAWIEYDETVITPERVTTLWSVNPAAQGITFDNPPGAIDNGVTFTVPGKYELLLEAFVDGVLVYDDTVWITVNYENEVPYVWAGSTKKGQLLSGVVDISLDDSWIWNEGVTYESDPVPIPPDVWPVATWTKDYSNPSGAAVQFLDTGLDTSNLLHPTVRFSESSFYRLKLTAENASGQRFNTVDVAIFDEGQSVIVDAGKPKEEELDNVLGYAEVYLYDATIIVRSTSLVDVQWTVVGGNSDDVKFFDYSISQIVGEVSILNPIVRFTASGTYVLRLTATLGGASIYSDVTVTIYPEGVIEADLIAPTIISVEVTDEGGVDISEGSNVDGLMNIRVLAEDDGWGMRSIELELADPPGNCAGAMPLKTVSVPHYHYTGVLELNYTLNTRYITPGPKSLCITATDAADNYTDPPQTFNFTNANPDAGVDPPVATITNDIFYENISTWTLKTNPLPVISDDSDGLVKGLFNLTGLVEAGVRYKIELFEPQIRGYREEWEDRSLFATNEEYNTNFDSLHSQFFIKNITPNADSEGYAPGTGALTDVYLDFSAIENGTYGMMLTAEASGLFSHTYVEFILDCPLKLGNVKFSHEDLVVPVGGMPLRVVRSYDSLRRNKDSEFGFGWSYSIADMDIELDEERIGPLDNLYDSTWYTRAPRIMRIGSNYSRNVTLTLPDGSRATFVFYLDSGIAKYASPPGVNARLETEKTERLYGTINSVLYWGYQCGGDEDEGTAPFTPSYVDPANYDFSGFTLTTEDGTRYIIDRLEYNNYDGDFYYLGDTVLHTKIYGEPYLSQIILPNNDTIDFNVNLTTGKIGTIEYRYADGTTDDKTIEVIYDVSGTRIVAINGPKEAGELFNGTPTIKYFYDNTHGNLIEMHKLVDKSAGEYEITKYNYEDLDNGIYEQYHYVTDIKDPRGLSPIMYSYDDAGRLEAVRDAKGQWIYFDHDAEDAYGRHQIVTDRLNNITRYYFNDRGSVTRIVNALGYETIYEYTDTSIGEPGDLGYEPRNPDSPTAVMVALVENPDPLTSSDWSITQYAYDSKGRTTVTIDPELNVTTNLYDSSGNVLKTTQWRPVSGVAFPIDTFDYGDSGTWPLAGDYLQLSTTENSYNGDNLLQWTKVTELIGGTPILQQTNYTYDGKNRLSEVRKMADPLTGPSDSDILTTYWYDDGLSNSLHQPYSVSEPYYYNGGTTPDYVRFFHYDENGNQDATWYDWTDPSNSNNTCRVSTVSVYDDAGRVEETRREISNATGGIINSSVILSQTEYTSIGKVDYTINENDVLTKYKYDELGNLVEMRTYSVDGIDTSDPDALNSHLSDPANVLTISQTYYDAEGRAVMAIGPYDPAGPLPVGTETVYDALGRVVESRRWADVQIDMENVLNYDYEVVGRRSTGWNSSYDYPLSYARTIYDVGGRVKHSIALPEPEWDDALGGASGGWLCVENPTTYEYDKAGKQIGVIDPKGHQNLDTLTYEDIALNGYTAETPVIARKTDYGNFDATYLTGDYITETQYEGTRRWKVTDARGNTTEFQYDALGRLIKTAYPATTQNPVTYIHVGYNGLGWRTWQSEQTTIGDPTDPTIIGREFEYDAAGRLTAVELPEPEDGAGVPQYEYFYNDYGNMIAILDPLSHITVFKYDHLNRQTAKYVPFVPDPALPADPTVTDIYDALDTALAGANPPSVETRVYDGLGRLRKSVDYAGKTTIYGYNTRGQLEYKDYYQTDPSPGLNPGDPGFDPQTATESVEYTYDTLGRKYQVIEARGTTTYYYDDEGRVVEVNAPQGVVYYDYNDITGRKESTYTTNTDTDFFYDKLGRLNQVSTDNEDVTYGYDVVGNREWMEIDADGTTGYEIRTEYTYDQLNRLDTLINRKVSGQISSFDYTVAADGMRKQALETLIYPDSTTENQTVDYTYDNLNRLTGEDAYDDATPTANGYNSQYTYDLVGNRLTRGVTIQQSAAELYTEYEYDDNDRLLRETHTDTIPVAMIYREDGPYYAHITGDDIYYTAAGKPGRIGQFKAFFLGLPSAWNQYLLFAVLFLVPVLFLLPVIVRFLRRLAKALSDQSNLRLSLYHRCMSVLLVYVMLISPVGLQSLAQGATAYSEISTLAWGQNDRIIEYGQWDGALGTSNFITGYDDNGSVTEKLTYNTNGTTSDRSDDTLLEEISYEYNLQNRLETVTTDDQSGTVKVIEYKYNTSGIRVSKHTWTEISGVPQGDDVTVIYLADAYNHTGYAQTLEELTFNMADPVVGTDTPDSVTTYTIGDDVIAQNVDGTSKYLLYDGHGSTRQLTDSAGAVLDSYSYDAYGVMLGTDDTTAANADTSLLYAGEQFDINAQMYYLRARYYNPSNGLFNRMDPFAGNNRDPQSLHKYLYAHNNPVNNIDPSGMMTLAGVLVRVGIAAIMASILLPAIHGAYTRAKSVAARMNQSSVFSAIFKGAFTWNDWKQVILGFGAGAEAGAINALDTLTFRLVNPLHEYRDNLWQQEELQESWIGTATNVFAWAGTASLYAAAAVWTWNAMGGGTMDIAVKYTGEPGLYYHVQYGANGIWQEALGRVGQMPIRSVLASEVEGSLLTGIPVLYPEAVMGSGYAYNCLVAALKAFGRGWGF